MITDFFTNVTPHAPWTAAETVGSTADYTTHHKPAMCEHGGNLFLAWANPNAPNSWSYTTWLEDGLSWDTAVTQSLGDGKKQAHTSALVVFNGVLYAIIPWESSSDKGCDWLRYDGSAFTYMCAWGPTWCTPITAIEHEGVLHVVGYNTSDSNHFVWSYSEKGTNTLPGPFSDNIRINESTTSNPALYVRDGSVRLMFLAGGDGRSVLETTLTMGDSPSWARSNDNGLNESGNSGISAISNPAGDRSWICFKTHNGSNNLMCHWEKKKGSWSENIPLGYGIPFVTKNEAALCYYNTWVYTVWNTAWGTNPPMYWSRRPIKHMDPESWMSLLVDQSISISALSIPGTHDSTTSSWHGAIGHVNGMIRCQDMSITQQLDAGIRYFDIRMAYHSVSLIPDLNMGLIGGSSVLYAYHGEYDLGVPIETILGYFYSWLNAHPTEGIIIQLKADGPEGTVSQNISNSFYTLIESDIQKYWVVSETIPTLNQIKGKIQLVRRVPRPDACDTRVNGVVTKKEPFGINAFDSWPNNTSGLINNTLLDTTAIPVSLWVEDNYSFDRSGASALQEKKKCIEAFLVKANQSSSQPSAPMWFIGYSSYITESASSAGSVFTKGLADTNFNYATENLDGLSMNASLEASIKAKGKHNDPGLVGTVVMDYPNWKSGTLIESIIYTNALNLTE